MNRKIISILIIIGLWQIIAMIINKSVIMPYPFIVFKRMIEQLQSVRFYISIIMTLLRILLSFIIAMILGVTLGLTCGLNAKIKDYISPIISIIQTIPQIAYILIFLVWFRSLTCIILIISIMLIPVFYYNTLYGIENIDNELKDVILLYHQPLSYTIPHIYLPLIRGYILSAIDTCLPLSLKIGVMAEIFVQTAQGIGNELYIARVQIDMTSIFAWTIWMIILIFMILKLYRYITKKRI